MSSSLDVSPDRLQNLRDVGGLPLVGGGAVRPGVLYRSDAPWAQDVAPPVPWPPRIVLDLRSGSEVTAPHPLATLGARVVSLPLSSAASVGRLLDDTSAERDDLGPLYLSMLLDRGDAIAEAAALVAGADGPTLVHCAAGKDRTGTLIAVLLLAVGVEEQAVVADYLRTREHVPGVLARLAADPAVREDAGGLALLPRERPGIFEVSDGAVRTVVDHLAAAGGAGAWLLANGLSEARLKALRARLTTG